MISNKLNQINSEINKSGNWDFLAAKDIMDRERPNELYLRRFIIFKTPFISLYIHKFFRSDYFIPHDHPWDFLTLILRGSYIEHVYETGITGRMVSYIRKPWQLIFRRAEHLHRVILHPKSVSPLPITICLTGPVKRDWKFKQP